VAWVEYLGNEQYPTSRRPNPKRIQKMKNSTSDDDIATFGVGYGTVTSGGEVDVIKFPAKMSILFSSRQIMSPLMMSGHVVKMTTTAMGVCDYVPDDDDESEIRCRCSAQWGREACSYSTLWYFLKRGSPDLQARR
jgi:hypothetical protein